ncbi:hypothetical protein [Wenyingzhuangia sp. IMCC45467]
MKFNRLIFIQAAADLQHALDIYGKYKGENIYICVVNVKLVYEYLLTLPLMNVTLIFYPYIKFNIKNPLTYLKARKKLELIWLNDFEEREFDTVYFFSRFYDWFTASLIVKLSKQERTKVLYYDHYDDASVKNDEVLKILSLEGIRLRGRAMIHSFISKASFKAKHAVRNLEFCYDKYQIKKNTPPSKITIDEEFLFKVKTSNRKIVLFFISPGEVEMLRESSLRIIIDLINELRAQNYFIILKGHPRLGNPIKLVPYFDEVIPNNVPSEFISYINVQMTIGIISTALNFATSIEGIQVFSIINILEFKKSQKKEFYLNYLKELSKNKINFVDNKKFINE